MVAGAKEAQPHGIEADRDSSAKAVFCDSLSLQGTSDDEPRTI